MLRITHCIMAVSYSKPAVGNDNFVFKNDFKYSLVQTFNYDRTKKINIGEK